MRKCRRCKKPFNGSHYQVGNDGICSRCHEKEYMLPKEVRNFTSGKIEALIAYGLTEALKKEAVKAVDSVIGEEAKKREKECERQGRLIELRRFEVWAATVDARMRKLLGLDEFMEYEKRSVKK